MDPRAAAAALRTFGFLSRSALMAAFSASTFPCKRPKALTALARLSAFAFFNPSRSIPHAFSSTAGVAAAAGVLLDWFAAGACANVELPATLSKLRIPLRTLSEWRPIQDCLLFISLSILGEDLMTILEWET